MFGSICVVFMNMVFNYVGVDPFASLFTMIGIATGVMCEADIPQKVHAEMLVLAPPWATWCPALWQRPNILCQNILKDFGVTSLVQHHCGLYLCAVRSGCFHSLHQ